MTAYICITLSLLLYPILGWFIVKQTKNSSLVQKRIIRATCLISGITTLGCLFHMKTISPQVNWFLVTFIYLTLSIVLWKGQIQSNLVLKRVSTLISILLFVTGYFAATFGFFFLMIFSMEQSIQYESELSGNLLYQERNIGSGPDPSIKRKKIEVYKKVGVLPLIVYRIAYKDYDNWGDELGPHLEATHHQRGESIILRNSLEYENRIERKYSWTDTLKLK